MPDLRVVDDRRGDERAEHAAVRDRERAAGEIIHRELAVARALRHVRDLARDLEHAFRVRVLDVRYDEPLVGCDRDAHVHVVLVDDRVAVDLGVDDGIRLERHACRAHEERHEGELDAVLLLDALLEPVAKAHHRGHVDFVERREVRGLVLRLEQMLGDALAARGHLLARFARAREGAGGAGGAGRRWQALTGADRRWRR